MEAKKIYKTHVNHNDFKIFDNFETAIKEWSKHTDSYKVTECALNEEGVYESTGLIFESHSIFKSDYSDYEFKVIKSGRSVLLINCRKMAGARKWMIFYSLNGEIKDMGKHSDFRTWVSENLISLVDNATAK